MTNKAKVKPLRSIGFYTEGLPTGAEYAIRDDGSVFYYEKYFDETLGMITTSVLTRVPHMDELFRGCPETLAIGYAQRGDHKFVKSTKVKFPKVKKVQKYEY